jgi:hypothetical protein
MKNSPREDISPSTHFLQPKYLLLLEEHAICSCPESTELILLLYSLPLIHFNIITIYASVSQLVCSFQVFKVTLFLTNICI